MIYDILKSIDWPETVVIIDFESYYTTEYSMSKISTIEYITDPRFDLTGLGIQIDNGARVFFGKPLIPYAISRLRCKYGDQLQGCTVVAKNCLFDVTVLAEKFGIIPPHVIDIDDLLRYYDSRMSHRLKDVARLFELPPKGETVQFKDLHWEDMDEVKRIALKNYCLRDIEDEKSLLDILLPVIDNPAFELYLARHTLDLYLKPILELDTAQANTIRTEMSKALQTDLDTVSWVLDYGTKTKNTVEKILRAKTIMPKILADILPEGEQVPMKQGKKDMIPALAQGDVSFQLLLAHSNERVRNLCKAKAACTSWPLHQAKVNSMIAQSVCSNGKLRIPLKYYGAHSGRWSGTEDWNPLNMGGKGRGRAIHPLIAQVRNTVCAPPGYTLIVCDSAQVEARELAWFTGQKDLVKGFANNEDIYSNFATKLFGKRVWKPSKEEKETPEGKIADIRRGFGKDAILGAGYNMGALTFFDRCRQNTDLRPYFDSGEYDFDFVDKLIKTYRSMYSEIPKFWKTIEDQFRVVTKYPAEVRTCGVNDMFKLWREGSTTIIQLPSGRRLFYHHASVSIKENRIGHEHGAIYGGLLTENVDQAMCRDLLAGWLIECEKIGVHIVTHTYDELVGVSPIETAEEDLKKMQDIMCISPDWAAGLPLGVDSYMSERYKK